MIDTQQGSEPIVDEQAKAEASEDQIFDTLEAAVDALEDDGDAEEQPADEADGAEDGEESEAEDDVEVALDDGETVTLKELKASYFRSKDYTFKTTEVANERKAVEARGAQLAEQTSVIETALQNLSGYLESLIPPEPPLQLARTNPNEYQYQIASRQKIIAELGELITIKGTVDELKARVSEADMQAYRDREQAALVKSMPVLSDPAKRASFEASVKTAAKAFGFSDDEIRETYDHRIWNLVHYARLGKKAEENRQNAGRRVETPKLAKPAATAAPVNVNNRKAMHALSKSGSIKDALGVDFD